MTNIISRVIRRGDTARIRPPATPAVVTEMRSTPAMKMLALAVLERVRNMGSLSWEIVSPR
jgi:hypothetical protein